MPAKRKPNLILFLPDQQRADTLACYGGVQVHAPNLNKLASESVVFERAYVTHPVCTPSRSSLMTGTWPHNNGCTRNSVPLDRRFLVFPELMKDKDYRTAYMGKWHLGGDGPAGRGFQQWVSTDDHGDYTNFLLSENITPDKSNERFSELAISNLPLELSRPKFLEKHACEFIEKHQRDPFILVVGFVEPHSPYNGPLNNEHPLDEVDLDVSATVPESEDIPLRYRLMREWQQAEAILDRERLPTQLFFGITPDEYRSIKQRYLGLVTLVDQSIGSILECLERCDLGDHTIVVHTSDHGDSLGAHHLFGKETMFEEAARVPFLIRLPRQTRTKIADIARSSPPAGASPVRGQKSVAGYQSGSCGGRRVACVAEPRKCFYRMGTEPNKDKKREQARSAPHDQTRRGRIHQGGCYSRWLETLSARQRFERAIQVER